VLLERRIKNLRKRQGLEGREGPAARTTERALKVRGFSRGKVGGREAIFWSLRIGRSAHDLS